jgi:ABC-type multidrug transport system fused ATPase/permease subunit
VPPLLLELLRTHRRTITALLSATLVQMAMTLAVPWPLKSILDNVVGNHPARYGFLGFSLCLVATARSISPRPQHY